jgi:hypothetical protein
MTVESIALFVHLTTIFTLIPVIIGNDLAALLWVRGTIPRLSLRLLTWVHWIVWGGLILMIGSGLTMFLSYQDYLLSLPAFYVKMGFVAALVVNAFVIGKHHPTASERTYASLSPRERRPLFVSAGVSTAAWVGAYTAAQFLGM